jgi:hypothetical protein
MRLQKTKTDRGFVVIRFVDRYGVECSLQKSSLAGENAIWFGCDNANPRILIPGASWQPISMPDGYLADTRMHLNRKQVLSLLPRLIKFVIMGDI